MRLIDADVFKRYVMNSFYDSEHLFKKKETRDVAKQLAEAICQDIDEQSTAYDVDKVVKQLEDRSVLARPVGWSKAYEIVTLQDVIEIVKAGGIENVNSQSED